MWTDKMFIGHGRYDTQGYFAEGVMIARVEYPRTEMDRDGGHVRITNDEELIAWASRNWRNWQLRSMTQQERRYYGIEE